MIIPCPCGVSFEDNPEEGIQYIMCPSCGREAEISVDIHWPMEDEDD